MITYKKICDTVSLYSDSELNETHAVRKIIYEITAIRKNKNKLTLTVNAHRADGDGMPFIHTDEVSNMGLVNKLNMIGKEMDHYYIKLRPGHTDFDGNICFTGDEETVDIGKKSDKNDS